MQKQIIEVLEQKEDNQDVAQHRPMSEELQEAIQGLISKLREGQSK